MLSSFLHYFVCIPAINLRVSATVSCLISLLPPSAFGPSSPLSQRIILEQKSDAKIPPQTPSSSPASSGQEPEPHHTCFIHFPLPISQTCTCQTPSQPKAIALVLLSAYDAFLPDISSAYSLPASGHCSNIIFSQCPSPSTLCKITNPAPTLYSLLFFSALFFFMTFSTSSHTMSFVFCLSPL